MRRIAHISDVHFGRVDPAVVEALIASLNEAQPDLIVASGDFTQSARRREFEAARAFLDRLGAPVIAVPGNHDLAPYDLIERFIAPYARYRRFIATELEPVWQDDEIGIVGIKSSRRVSLRFNWAVGAIGQRQLERALRRLNGLPADLMRIVVVHHPLLLPEQPNEHLPKSAMTAGAASALDAFARANVQLVLSGHLHLSYTRRRSPVVATPTVSLPAGQTAEVAEPAAALPALANGSGGPLVVQAASATSTRLRDEPNAYNWITIDRGTVQIEVRAWDGRRLFARVEPAPGADQTAAELPASGL